MAKSLMGGNHGTFHHIVQTYCPAPVLYLCTEELLGVRSFALLCHTSVNNFRGRRNSFSRRDILSHPKITVLFLCPGVCLGDIFKQFIVTGYGDTQIICQQGRTYRVTDTDI